MKAINHSNYNGLLWLHGPNKRRDLYKSHLDQNGWFDGTGAFHPVDNFRGHANDPRYVNNFDLWATIQTNVSQGVENLKLLAQGRPLDALASSASQKVKNDIIADAAKKGTPLTAPQIAILDKQVNVVAAEKALGDRVSNVVGGIGDFLGSIKWVLIGVVVLVLVLQFGKR